MSIGKYLALICNLIRPWLAIMCEHLKALTTTYNDFKKNGGVELYSKWDKEIEPRFALGWFGGELFMAPICGLRLYMCTIIKKSCHISPPQIRPNLFLATSRRRTFRKDAIYPDTGRMQVGDSRYTTFQLYDFRSGPWAGWPYCFLSQPTPIVVISEIFNCFKNL
jgi:hypothetical protein